MKKIVIGLVGEVGSGKDTVGKYLEEKYGAKQVRFADPIKDTLSIYFDKLSRVDQQWLFLAFQERFGDDILSRAIRKKIEDEEHSIVVVNGLRMPPDLAFIRSFENNKILYVTASTKTRWERASKRDEKSDDSTTFENFEKIELKPTEINVPKIGAEADTRIDNEKDLEHLLVETDKFMNSLEFQKIS
ncbi:MAG: AAA family ATPase [Candidatus Moranbacteria bacterium]|nr:AAA family ATPase [Candidatus Moranbacteria bacterium]